MLFNSLEFAFFLPIVFSLFWFLPKNRVTARNCLLLIASYFFYAWWDWRFLTLIFLSSLVDFIVGRRLVATTKNSVRKWWLFLSLFVNLGFLMAFKYYGFFVQSFVDAFSFFGYNFAPERLNIVLPVGISFYTFQTLSYTLDIYRGRIGPTKKVIDFFAYVSFFPQLVAGPIERASHLLPQFRKIKSFNFSWAMSGFRLILWGLFKKVVVADNCAMVVNQIFSQYQEYSGSTLLLGCVLFGFQIYGDFSGYSDIAVGTGRLFGFDLMQNFRIPYFSRNIAEFWRRWHISLTTWFRDYLYIPLGGSRGNRFRTLANVFIVFVVSGLWHGANWTFIAWGFVNAMMFVPLLLLNRNRVYVDTPLSGKYFPSFQNLFKISVTFFLVNLSWIFFRSETITDAINYLGAIFDPSIFTIPYVFGIGLTHIGLICVVIMLLVYAEWLGKEEQQPIDSLVTRKDGLIYNIGFCTILITSVFFFGGQQQEFIYFQF